MPAVPEAQTVLPPPSCVLPVVNVASLTPPDGSAVHAPVPPSTYLLAAGVPVPICAVLAVPLRSEKPSCASTYCVPLFRGTWPAVFVAVLSVLREMSKVLLVRVCVSVSPTMLPDGAVLPLCNCAFRFGTTVVLAIENGAVPVATVDTIC